MQQQESGLVFGFLLDGNGGALPLQRSELAGLQLQAQQKLWLHWDKDNLDTQDWLQHTSQVSELERQLLLAKGTRPRLLEHHDQTLLLFSRVLARNYSLENSALLSLRVLVKDQLLLSFAHADAYPDAELEQSFKQNTGPRTTTELLTAILKTSAQDIDVLVEQLADFIDTQEESMVQDIRFRTNQKQMLQLRRDSANLRRYLIPMRDLFSVLQRVQTEEFNRNIKAQLGEIHNSTIRSLEELDLSRDRVGFILEAEKRQREERSGRTIYLLTLITAFFLPLSFVTGLLGINLGGIPGGESELGFILACVGLGILAIVQLALLRLLRWL